MLHDVTCLFTQILLSRVDVPFNVVRASSGAVVFLLKTLVKWISCKKKQPQFQEQVLSAKVYITSDRQSDGGHISDQQPMTA